MIFFLLNVKCILQMVFFICAIYTVEGVRGNQVKKSYLFLIYFVQFLLFLLAVCALPVCPI